MGMYFLVSTENIFLFVGGQHRNKRFRWLEYIFFGNYFYGLCAIALSIEATVQQRFPLNGLLYFSLVFTATVLYYNYPYTRKYAIPASDIRTTGMHGITG